MLGPFHGVIDQIACDKLIVTFTGECTVHLDVGLIAVSPVLVQYALVQVFIRALYVTGVNRACGPERPFGVKRFVEVAGVAAWVGERQMEAVWRILCEEPVRH